MVYINLINANSFDHLPSSKDLKMEEITIKSTSRFTVEATDIGLRETETTRLIFRPVIIENPNNTNACLKGSFLFQRKSKNEQWEDFETISLASLKMGEGYKLGLDSAELLKFMKEIVPLYKLHREGGVIRGQTKYVRATPQLELLANLTESEISNYLDANTSIGTSLLTKLLNWAANLDDPTPLINHLVALNPTSLCKLNAAIGLQSLKKALSIWESNADNLSEEFWQKSLTEHSFVLEQVFSWPVSIAKGKAYLSCKSYLNTGGNIVDFLMRNRLTQCAALIEIKTPSTLLLGAVYRGSVYNTSNELSGSIMQILNYKHSLQENFTSLTNGQDDLFDSFNPQCAVIIGNAGVELNNKSKTKSFELFRHQFPGLVVITFDELFNKTKQLINLLENPTVVEDDFEDGLGKMGSAQSDPIYF